jgi:hypothetical protein
VLGWSGLRAAFVSVLVGAAVFTACAPDYDFVTPKRVQHCENNLFQPELGETDLDCGGADCKDCELGQACLESGDCREGECLSEFCQQPGCDNTVQDNTETDTDCGGDCKPCTVGQTCLVPSDCDSSLCTDEGTCAGAACDDGIKNGAETARDCGGGSCDGCPPGSPCLTPVDCTSGVCDEATMRCIVFCIPGTDECDADLSVECETNILTSADHCGACNEPCEFDHAVPSCSGGRCSIAACEDGWANCNDDEEDGCETDVTSSVEDCGGCGEDCPAVNGKPGCEDSECTIDCSAGFEDCNEDASDGCEARITDVLHCGGCEVVCTEDEGYTAYCDDGECGQTRCDEGLGNCNGDPDDECEADLTRDVENCGRCGGLCSVAHGKPGCDAELGCVVASCDAGWANCNSGNPDGGYDDGCEVNTRESPDHCGGCGEACSVENGTGQCTEGDCAVDGCDDGFGDCDGDYENGCETNIWTDKTSCGGCGVAGLICDDVFPNATGACEDGACEIDDCIGNFRDCTAERGCETNINTSDLHCGACGTRCQDVGGSNSCSDGTCMLTCDATHASCDMVVPNGCETSITGASAAAHCGNCMTACSSSTTCNSSGVCVPCPAGWGACTAPENGCTTQLNASPNCGACGKTCSGSTASCVATGNVYACQAAIAFRSEVHGSVQGNVLNVTLGLQGGANRLVLVGVLAGTVGDGNQGVVAARPDSVTYDSGGANTAMTFFAEMDGNAGLGSNAYRQTHIFYYYLVDSALGANGNKVVRVNAATAPSPNFMVVSAAQFDGVRQTTPLVTNATARTVRKAMDLDVTGTITLPISGSVIYSMASAYYAGTPVASSMGSSFISTIANSTTPGLAVGDEGQTLAVAGYRGTGSPLAAGDFTVGWDYFYHSFGFQFLVAMVPAQAP